MELAGEETAALPRQPELGEDDERIGDELECGQAPEPAVGLSVIQVSEGEGQFVLTAALSDAQPRVEAEVVPGGVRLRSGDVSRLVPLPEDSLIEEAVIRHVGDAVMVTIPQKERRSRRHIVHVW